MKAMACCEDPLPVYQRASTVRSQLKTTLYEQGRLDLEKDITVNGIGDCDRPTRAVLEVLHTIQGLLPNVALFPPTIESGLSMEAES